MANPQQPAAILLIIIVLAMLGIILSAGFRFVLGAPNFSLGIIIAVTAVCYLYGLLPAVLCFILATAGVIYWVIPPIGVGDSEFYAIWMRITTIFLVLVVTCGFVLQLRKSEREVRMLGENLQAQNEELQAQNEELKISSQELHDTQNQLADALQHERRIAQSLQQAFLPAIPKRINNFVLAATYEPGSEEAEIGGDFYDVFETKDGRLSLVIGDASGKGLNAARQAIAAKYGLRFCTTECVSPGQCLRILNNLLIRDPDFEGFVTLFYGILDPVTHQLSYCTGGHEPPILYREETKEVIKLQATGRFVGMVAGGIFEDAVIDLRDGDRLFMFTDGLSEAKGKDGLLGSDALEKMLIEVSEENASEGLDQLVKRTKNYTGGKLTDDAAAILLCID